MLQIAKLDLNYKLQLLAYEYQTQSPRGVLRKRRPQKFRKIHRKIPLPESLFNKVPGIRLATLLKRDSGTGDFLWILLNENTFFIEHICWSFDLIYLPLFLRFSLLIMYLSLNHWKTLPSKQILTQSQQ